MSGLALGHLHSSAPGAKRGDNTVWLDSPVPKCTLRNTDFKEACPSEQVTFAPPVS